MREVTWVALLGLLALGLSACEEETTKKPCPAAGLGVVGTVTGKKCAEVNDWNDPDLKDCQAQMEKYQEYDCPNAQVCPDRPWYQVPDYKVNPGASPEPNTFTLTNCSTGREKLTITKVEVAGDSRCMYTFSQATDVQPVVAGPGEQISVRALYKPTALGEDHAAFRIYTNAKNLPVLVLPMCGKGIPLSSGGGDGGPADGSVAKDTGGAKPDTGTYWLCKPVGDKIETCHKN